MRKRKAVWRRYAVMSWLGLGATVLLLWGCGEDPGAQLSPLSEDAVILAFGDSLTEGRGASRDSQSYPAVLEELIGRSVVNRGISGELSREGALRLPGVLDEVAPDLLLLAHGGNDLLKKHDQLETVSNLRKMIEAARARDVPVVLIGVPKPGILLSSAEFYGEIAEEYGLPYEGEVLAEVIGDRDLKADSVHPNAAGYRVVAEAVRDLLQRSGAL